MNLQKIKQQISKSIDRFLIFAEDKKKEKWVINHQYAQIVFIVKRSITSMKDKKTMTIIVKSMAVNVYNILNNKKWNNNGQQNSYDLF